MIMVWIRTCQECGYLLSVEKEPIDKTRPSYLNRKCPLCKSEAFDYGKNVSDKEVGEDEEE